MEIRRRKYCLKGQAPSVSTEQALCSKEKEVHLLKRNINHNQNLKKMSQKASKQQSGQKVQNQKAKTST